MKYRWLRRTKGQQQAVNEHGQEVARVIHVENCGYWYCYLWGCEDPDGYRFDQAWEAKMYCEEELAKGPDERWEPKQQEVQHGKEKTEAKDTHR